MTISAKQIALVHVAAKQLGIEDDVYRAVLARWGDGAASAKDLDHAGFEAVMLWFNAHGFRSTWTKRTYGKRPGMATPAQVELIRKLWREWAGSDDEPALYKWLERRYHVAALRFLDREGASKAINGLQAMTSRKRAKADAPAANTCSP